MQRPVKPGADVIQAADHAETLGRQPWPLVEGESYFFADHGIYGTVTQCSWWGCLVDTDADGYNNDGISGHTRSSMWNHEWRYDSSRKVPLQWSVVGFVFPIQPKSVGEP